MRYSDTVVIDCQNSGTECSVDCRDTNSCTVDCRNGASCELLCRGATTCGFGTCEGGETMCGGGRIVCNDTCG